MKRKREVRSRADAVKLLKDKTEFEREVLVTAFEIPRGKVSTYKRIAEKIGKPHAYRAVGNALHKNPLAPIVPCHRVIRSDGHLGGHGEGVKARKRLLEEEGIPFRRGRVELRKEILF